MIRCTTNVGVGLNHVWSIVVGGQVPQGTSANSVISSYASPSVIRVTADTASGMFSTAGGEWALVSGFNFGPADSTNLISALYTNRKLSALGMSLVSDDYEAEDCEVVELYDKKKKC